MPIEHAADVLEEIDPDDAADIIVRVDPEFSEDILVAMEPADAAEIRELMAYRPDTAGGIMTPGVRRHGAGTAGRSGNCGVARVAEEAETINYVYVTDKDEHLLGVLSLHRLVLSRPDSIVSSISCTGIRCACNVDDDQEDVARLLTERHFLALPVVDDENRILRDHHGR